MSRLTSKRPSAAFVVAVFALCFALVGSAIAGTDSAKKALSKSQVKKIAKKQADKEINKKAPGLSVAHATSADSATNATNATTAANGAAAYAEVNPDGTVRPGALNMNDLTVSSLLPYVYCEDQELKAAQATGGLAPTGAVLLVTALSDEQIEALPGTTMGDIGCPADTQWAFVTFANDGTGVPGPFQAMGF
jgi:hypothetical protein